MLLNPPRTSTPAIRIVRDHLVFDDIPRRPLHTGADQALGDRLAGMAELGTLEQEILGGVIDALLTNTRLRAISSDGG
jgi:hypothetical protein